VSNKYFCGEFMNQIDNIKTEFIEHIYNKIFRNVYINNVDIFLCGGSNSKKNISTRNKLNDKLKNKNEYTIMFPEDLFMELINKKAYDLLELEKFLANNCDVICIVCESPGSFVELGAFVNSEDTFSKVVALVQTKYKNSKSFIMLGPIRHIQSKSRSNVIFYSSDIDYLLSQINRLLKKKFFSHFSKPRFKDIDLITGQYYFILLILYFYKNVEIKSLVFHIQKLYKNMKFDIKNFDIVYSSAIRRLYKERLIEKSHNEDNTYFYHLSSKGFISAKLLIKNTHIVNKTRIVDGIRLSIIRDKYY